MKYPIYSLEVYAFSQSTWVPVAGTSPGNEPHAYDRLRAEYERLIRSAKDGSQNQQPIGYRIMVRHDTVVDCWTNGKVE